MSSRSCPVLEVQNLCKTYRHAAVLNNVNCSIAPGEIVCLLGANASGKTTLSRLISGVEKPDSGQILIDGDTLSFSSPREAIQHGIQMVHQTDSLQHNLNIAENLFFEQLPSQKIANRHKTPIIHKKKLYQQASDLFQKCRMTSNVKARLDSLSAEDQQIIAILRALIMNPRLIILDEPNLSMNDVHWEPLVQMIRDYICERHASVLYITHSIEEALSISDRILIIRNGSIVDSISTSETSSSELLRSLASLTETQRYPKLKVPRHEELLKVQNISFGSVLHNISFTLYGGEIVGLFGLQGSGRTCLAKTISGVLSVDAGTIFVHRIPQRFSSSKEALHAGICYIPQASNLYGLIESFSVSENMTLPFYARYSDTMPVINKNAERAVTQQYIDALSITCYDQTQKASTLSSGNQQKIMLSRGILASADILIMDEPTRFLDPASRIHVYNILNELVRNGKGILLISSDISELLGMCDRILVINKGTLAKEYSQQEASAEKLLSHAST